MASDKSGTSPAGCGIRCHLTRPAFRLGATGGKTRKGHRGADGRVGGGEEPAAVVGVPMLPNCSLHNNSNNCRRQIIGRWHRARLT